MTSSAVGRGLCTSLSLCVAIRVRTARIIARVQTAAMSASERKGLQMMTLDPDREAQESLRERDTR